MLDINMLKDKVEDFKKYSLDTIKLENNGHFYVDQDPVDENSYTPLDETFPYIRRGIKWGIKWRIYNKALDQYTKKINKTLTNLKIVGKKNLKGVKSAIITCNHVSKVDSFAVRAAVKENIMFVAAEFNNWKGMMGEIARNTGYIPLPSNLNLKLMRKFNEAIKYYLKKGRKILIYPEQAMWREYKKPRPLQSGAYHYAALNNVPILPMFITIEDKPQLADENGMANFGNYTIHILPPIYPKKELSVKENEKYLKLENFRLWKDCYETNYGEKLAYSTKLEIWADKFSEYNQFFKNKPAKKSAEDKNPTTKKTNTKTKSTSKKSQSTNNKKSKKD